MSLTVAVGPLCEATLHLRQSHAMPQVGRSWGWSIPPHLVWRTRVAPETSYGAASVSEPGGPGLLLRVVQTDLMRRGAQVSQVLARERTVAAEANPRAISQMANVSSNNPPGMAATSAAPATPNSSSRLPAAKHA